METTGSLFLSLNADSDLPSPGKLPGSVELIPAGAVVRGRDGRTWKNSNPQKVVRNSMSRLSRLVVDENHATDLSAPKGGASPAMGWMTNLRTGEGGSIWADVEWTKRGEQAVLNKEYSFISPVFLYDKQGEITVILRAALLNSPNLQLPALNGEQSSHEQSSRGEPETNNTEASMNKELCAALGLSETATEAEALAAVQALQSKAALNAAKPEGNKAAGVDLSAYAPRADLNAMEGRALAAEQQLAALNAAKFKAEVEGVIDQAVRDRKITPASKDLYLGLCSTSEQLENLKKAFTVNPAVISTESQAPEGAPPAGGGGAALNAEEAGLAKALGYTAEEYQKIKEVKK
jgi:phage I-like protein